MAMAPWRRKRRRERRRKRRNLVLREKNETLRTSLKNDRLAPNR